MCLLKNNISAAQPVGNGDVHVATLEMEDCNQTNGICDDTSTSSELDCSVIIVDE